MGTSRPHVLTGRYVVVGYGALPGAIVMVDDETGKAHVSELSYSFPGGSTVLSMTGPVEICDTREDGIKAAEGIAARQQ